MSRLLHRQRAATFLKMRLGVEGNRKLTRTPKAMLPIISFALATLALVVINSSDVRAISRPHVAPAMVTAISTDPTVVNHFGGDFHIYFTTLNASVDCEVSVSPPSFVTGAYLGTDLTCGPGSVSVAISGLDVAPNDSPQGRTFMITVWASNSSGSSQESLVVSQLGTSGELPSPPPLRVIGQTAELSDGHGDVLSVQVAAAEQMRSVTALTVGAHKQPTLEPGYKWFAVKLNVRAIKGETQFQLFADQLFDATNHAFPADGHYANTRADARWENVVQSGFTVADGPGFLWELYEIPDASMPKMIGVFTRITLNASGGVNTYTYWKVASGAAITAAEATHAVQEYIDANGNSADHLVVSCAFSGQSEGGVRAFGCSYTGGGYPSDTAESLGQGTWGTCFDVSSTGVKPSTLVCG